MVPYIGDYNTTETVVIPFNTFDSNDPTGSVTITDLLASDIEIHKDGSATQRASGSGVSVSIDYDSVTGNHLILIDLSDNSDAGFYSDGSRYQVRIEGTTVDGGTVNAWITSFSIGCTLRPTTAGRTLDIQNTGEVDSNITMIGGSLPAAGSLQTASLNYTVARGLAGTALPNAAADAAGGLPISDAGGLDLDTLASNVDTILTDVQSGGYVNGMIWINTISGVSGTTPYVHGTVTQPVNNWADALTLSSSLGLTAFFLVGASSITLTGNSDGYRFYGNTYTLTLNGQSVSGTWFNGGYIVGNDDGSNTIQSKYENCILAGQTLGQYILRDCRIDGNITFAEAGNYDHHGCSFMGSSVQVDFGATIGTVTSVYHGCAGNIQILNLGAVATDIIRVAGIGEVEFAASCVGGNAYISGVLKVIDSSGGAVTIDSDADIVSLVNGLNDLSSADVNAACDTALADYDPPTKTELDTGFSDLQTHGDLNWGASGENPNVLLSAEINTITSQTVFTLLSGSDQDDAYNDQSIVLYDNNNSDFPSVRVVSDYVGATKTVTIDSAPDFTLAADDSVRIFVTAPGSTAPTASQIADAVWEEAIADHTTATTFGGKNQIAVPSATLNDYKADVSTLATAANLQTVDDNVDLVLADTNEIQGDLANGGRIDLILDELTSQGDTNEGKIDSVTTELTKVPKSDGTSSWNATALAAINSQVDSALTSYDAVTDANLSAAFTEIKGATWSSLTDTLEHIRDKQTDIETDTGTTLPDLIAALNNISTTQVNTEVASALATYDSPTKTELDAGFAGLNDPTVAEIVTGILDEVLADITSGQLAAGQPITPRIALRATVNRLYRLVTQTATTQSVANDSGTTIATMTTSDDGTTQLKGSA